MTFYIVRCFAIRKPGVEIGRDVYEGTKVGWSECLAIVRVDSQVRWDPRVRASVSGSELASGICTFLLAI